MVRRPFFILFAVTLFIAQGLATPAQANRSEGIAAVVNDSIISTSDIQERKKLMLMGSSIPNTPQAQKQVENQILNMLIDEALQLQEAEKLGITIDKEQLDDGFAQIAQQNNTSVDDMKARLRQNGINITTLEDQIRAQLAWSMVVRRKLRPQINVSEGEIDAALDVIESRSDKTQYHVAEIFLPVDQASRDTLVRAEMEKLLQQLLNGASFSAIAREFSKAPGAANGGDLGWVQEDQLRPVLEEAVIKMKPGQISPPLRSDDGWHIVFLRNVRGVMPKPAMTEQTQENEDTNNTDPKTLVHLKQIAIPVATNEPQALVAAKATRLKQLGDEINSCETMAEKSKDFSSQGTGDLGTGDLAALPEPLQKVLADLPLETLSEPIKTPDSLVVLMVCDRKTVSPDNQEQAAEQPAPAPAPAASSINREDDQAREQVANQLGMKRLDQLQERYLRDLRATAFIEKRL